MGIAEMEIAPACRVNIGRTYDAPLSGFAPSFCVKVKVACDSTSKSSGAFSRIVPFAA